MPTPSSTHVVLIPSYNPGPKVYDTVRAARQQWSPVWVIVDGSDDGSAEGLQRMAAEDDGLQVFHRQGTGKVNQRMGVGLDGCLEEFGQHLRACRSWRPEFLPRRREH